MQSKGKVGPCRRISSGQASGLISGRTEELVGVLQERYGTARQQAEKEDSDHCREADARPYDVSPPRA
jgi:hypothetical protein